MRTWVNHSVVARLRERIEAEYRAAHAGLYGLSAGSTRHEFIQERMANAQEYSEQLIVQMGKEAAIPLIIEAMEAGSQQGQQEQSRSELAPPYSPGTGKIAPQ